MTTEEAMKKAMEGGYKIVGEQGQFVPLRRLFGLATSKKMYLAFILSDPSFWQSLGKAWERRDDCPACGSVDYEEDDENENWHGGLYHWHLFIDHLVEGKSPEELRNFRANRQP